ncbi:TRAP transporter large permease [Stella sp.]|uniref:TRAP transporter large permease n=1 Tax=Stella sp. TaxID=2912054 RepID=UPI0035AF11BB
MFWLYFAGGLGVTALTGLPIGIGLGLTGLAILHFEAGGATSLAVTAVWNVLTDFTLSSVPLFMFMGDLMMESGLSRRLYSGLAPLFHRVPGRLLHSNIAVCAMFGAVAGTSTSTAAAVGTVAYPELTRRGYDRPAVVASLAAGGTLGLLIPPSLSLLLYGATQQVSIGRLFLAGIIPGLMMAALFMAWIYISAKRNPRLTPNDGERPTLREQLLGLLGTWPLVVLVFACLGTVFLGWATPTEAAGLGVAAAIIVGFLFGDLTLRKTWDAFLNSTIVFGSIVLVIIGSLILSQAVSILGLPGQVMQSVVDLGVSKYWVLVLVVVVYLILGCFFDGVSLMLLTIPLAYPVMTGMGFDPIWLGVVITILIEVGMLTPPVGMNLFVLTAITKHEVSLGQAAQAAIPYWLLLLGGVLILTLFPAIALWLPGMMG